jgi:hypothetical protein
MSNESLINDSIVATVTIDASGLSERGNTAENSEYRRVFSALAAICKPTREENAPVVLLNGRAHRTIPSWGMQHGCQWQPHPNGGGVAKIIIHPEDEPAQQIHLKYTLAVAPNAPHRGWLTVEFNPTTLLTGNNVFAATIEESQTGEIVEYPSSSPKMSKFVYRLGFTVLEEMAQQVGRPTRQLLYCEQTRSRIREGRFHLTRAQWCAYLPVPDRVKFLQMLTVLFGQTIGAGSGIINLATHLGLKFTPYTAPVSHAVTGLMLEKRHGNKSVFSIVPYDKVGRIADVRQGKTLDELERATIENNVRFDMTAHSEGIVVIATAARSVLKRWRKLGTPFKAPWVKEFVTEEIKSEVWWLERAILILSQQWKGDAFVQRSFGRWLVPYMIRNVLRLDIIGTFTSNRLHELLALDDDIITVWRHPDFDPTKGWVEPITALTATSKSTIYERRKEWIEKFGIDIAIPYAFYRDLLFYAPNSLTQPEGRSALIDAVQDSRSDATLRFFAGSAADFERQRIDIVGKVVMERPLKMEPKIASIDRRAASVLLALESIKKRQEKNSRSESERLFPARAKPIARHHRDKNA